MMHLFKILGTVSLGLLLSACEPLQQQAATPPVPPAPSDAWSVRYIDINGNPTLVQEESPFYQSLISSSDAPVNLILGCQGSEVGAGYTLSIQRNARPLDAFANAASLNVEARVRGRTRTTYRRNVGSAPFLGAGPANAGGYTLNATPQLVNAMRNGTTLILTTPETGAMTFSLRGSARAILDLGC